MAFAFMKRLLIITSTTFSYRVIAWPLATRSRSRTSPVVIAAERDTINSCRFQSAWFSSTTGRQNRRVNLDKEDYLSSYPTITSQWFNILPTNAVLSQYNNFLRYDRLRMPTRLASSGSNQVEELEMENLYMEWTLEDDEFLYRHMNEDIPKLASKLGRGLRGVESRIAKLKDVNSPAYRRLFVENKFTVDLDVEDDKASKKLTPANEVMRRIKWDDVLNPDDFSVEYFDRVEERVISVAFGAKNDSVKGKEEMFVFAIPEHRIMTIKYKERVVWDKVRTSLRESYISLCLLLLYTL